MYGYKDWTNKISFYEGVEKFHGISLAGLSETFQLGKVSTTRRTFWLYFPFVSYESNQTMLWPAVHHGKDTTGDFVNHI